MNGPDFATEFDDFIAALARIFVHRGDAAAVAVLSEGNAFSQSTGEGFGRAIYDARLGVPQAVNLVRSTPANGFPTKTAAKPAKTDKTKRLTLDLDEGLHRRIKLACTIRCSTMVEEIAKLLETEFPAS